MTTKSKRGGRRDNPGGRPPKPLNERATWGGKVAIRIDVETAALAQRLMLHFPECRSVEALFSLALHKLAQTTDD